MILYLDMVSGISGDMALGGLVDLGVPIEWLKDRLATVLTGFDLRCEIVFPSHLRAVSVSVDVTDTTSHRHYSDIRSMIQAADLPEQARDNALTAFKKIAEAESRIHGKDIEHVHFHEIGAIDSLVDIIGTFLAVDYLGITRVAASIIPLGSGTITCAHGTIPVPVPATLDILKGLPVTQSDATTEIVTPTGAAIVATLADSFGPMPDMQISKTGYGAGKRDTGASAPNILRMVLGSPVAEPAGDGRAETNKAHAPDILNDQVMVIHTNVDDMNPEILGFVMERLLDKGALDVSFAPVFMKKNRPGTRLEVICKPCDLHDLARIVLSETTAIGLRYKQWDRMVLKREPVEIETDLGTVRAKKIVAPDGQTRIMPEYEDARQKALDHGLPLHQVCEQLARQMNPLDSKAKPIIQDQDTNG